MNDHERDLAFTYLSELGLDPNIDAIEQLAGPFTKALEIICTRGYTRQEDNNKEFFWMARGWKGLVHDILDNAFRIRLFSWERNEFYENGALDIINFAGFYLRQRNKGSKWGELGDPG
jgi:hypothetical protein